MVYYKKKADKDQKQHKDQKRHKLQKTQKYSVSELLKPKLTKKKLNLNNRIILNRNKDKVYKHDPLQNKLVLQSGGDDDKNYKKLFTIIDKYDPKKYNISSKWEYRMLRYNIRIAMLIGKKDPFKVRLLKTNKYFARVKFEFIRRK